MSKDKKQSFYNFRAEGQLATIDIFAEIDSWFGYSAERVKEDLSGFEGEKIVVNINSGGGSVTEGIAIANLLKADPRHVTTRAVGVAASIASVILLAGDTVEMAPGSFLMIHNVWGEAVGEAEDLRRTADVMDIMTKEISNVYVQAIKSRKGGDRRSIKKEVESLMTSESWLSAEAAKEAGLIDKISNFKKATATNKVQARLYNQLKKNFKKLPLNMNEEEIKNEEETKDEDVQNGSSLAAALQAKIDTLLAEDEEATQADIVEAMADAAGIDSGTVNQILRGDINCPPLERLEGFASALSMSMDEIMSAAESDGCNYGTDEDDDPEASKDCVDCNKAKEATEEIQSKGILSKIRSLLGFAPSNETKAADPKTGAGKEKELQEKLNLALAELETLRAQNTELKSVIGQSKKANKEALNVLKQTSQKLSKIETIQNREGKTFSNIDELILEYKALILHNKEAGGLPVNPGTPVASVESSANIEKRQDSKEVDLHARLQEIKNAIKQQEKDKK
jgi:ATP-dependent protease ClpP protease subunit/transcriptional regulator with XRE-family HTH domain